MIDQDLIKHRIVFITGSIDEQLSNSVISNLLKLAHISDSEPIEIYINSPGGSIDQGLAIIDVMNILGKKHGNLHIATVCLGQASSMAAWILAAGKKGRRYASENAKIMIHQASAGIRGETSDLFNFIQHLKSREDKMVSMFSQWTGQTKRKIRKDMERDFYMTSEAAMRYGIIDHIMTGEGDE
ncbi:MAG TPA: ATP-dependent Clp protease proteolytic subunit [Caldithrix abyssi]|uniref:ATP-dependent Clp protease proteolytic subunit n=1 Tax=Caldithrix abyssi TaxID=187145 RepID=A0A7V5RNE6_CALAY|nr:ATP-dependent Clp protease proteolytic subunit [Caldithrix abyssi]